MGKVDRLKRSKKELSRKLTALEMEAATTQTRLQKAATTERDNFLSQLASLETRLYDRNVRILELVEKCDDIPDDYLCPISQCLFKDPVKAADGRTYERSFIAEHIRLERMKKGPVLSPFRKPIPTFELEPDREMRENIRRFLDEVTPM